VARGRFFSAVEQLSRTCSSSSCETASRLKDFDKGASKKFVLIRTAWSR